MNHLLERIAFVNDLQLPARPKDGEAVTRGKIRAKGEMRIAVYKARTSS
jgi:hypothetical protein